ncbi:MAG TPA: lecithin retinol acyltransferase family protein [Burkholderiaceae bacterium]|nr:lecithin retinol acyltransferase family protein [Burkholderiaceae bacterium]
MSPDLPIGTHLTTQRRGYVHHGLYIGHGRVIHYAGLKALWHRGPVEVVSLDEFGHGHGWQVKDRSTVAFAGGAAVERALSRLGEDRYRIWSNNCEHFVEWCLSGTARSAQVERWIARLLGGFAGLRASRA